MSLLAGDESVLPILSICLFLLFDGPSEEEKEGTCLLKSKKIYYLLFDRLLKSLATVRTITSTLDSL
jgi:hypothetical protein